MLKTKSYAGFYDDSIQIFFFHSNSLQAYCRSNLDDEEMKEILDQSLCSEQHGSSHSLNK